MKIVKKTIAKYKLIILPLYLIITCLIYMPTQTQAKDLYNLEQGRQLFFQLSQDPNVLDECRDYFENLVGLNHIHQGLVLTYLAMITALEGRDSLLPWKKLQLVNQALASLRRQVKQYPKHFEIRLLRLKLMQNLPFFLRSDQEIIEEKEDLVELFKVEEKYLDRLVYKMAISVFQNEN